MAEDQLLPLNNERFSTPELLFRPSNIGLEQSGIGETVADSLRACPVELHAQLLSNIVLVGGNACFPGYADRVLDEIRRRVSHEHTVSLLPVAKCAFV